MHLWEVLLSSRLIACVHCVLQTNSVSCKQFSGVCTVCKCVFFSIFSLKPQLREREKESWERDRLRKTKCVFVGEETRRKWEESTRHKLQPPVKTLHPFWKTDLKIQTRTYHTDAETPRAPADKPLKSRSVYFLLKCPKWKPGLPITHRLSEETNNKWHPESVSVQTGSAAESSALQGRGFRGQPWH